MTALDGCFNNVKKAMKALGGSFSTSGLCAPGDSVSGDQFSRDQFSRDQLPRDQLSSRDGLSRDQVATRSTLTRSTCYQINLIFNVGIKFNTST